MDIHLRHVQILQFIDEVRSEGFDLVEIIVCDASEGHALRCVQHKEQVHRAFYSGRNNQLQSELKKNKSNREPVVYK